MEGFYSQVASTGFLGAEAEVLLLGLLVLLVVLFHRSEVFERLVGSRVRGPLYLAYGTWGLPLMLVLMEVQRRSGRGGGLFRFLGGLLLVVIVVIIGVLALIAFLLYRFLRRRR